MQYEDDGTKPLSQTSGVDSDEEIVEIETDLDEGKCYIFINKIDQLNADVMISCKIFGLQACTLVHGLDSVKIHFDVMKDLPSDILDIYNLNEHSYVSLAIQFASDYVNNSTIPTVTTYKTN